MELSDKVNFHFGIVLPHFSSAYFNTLVNIVYV